MRFNKSEVSVVFIALLVTGESWQANAQDDGTIGPFVNPSQTSPSSVDKPNPAVLKSDSDATIQEICQKYRHCETGKTEIGDAHRNDVTGYLNRLISFKRLENSRHSTPEKIAEIAALENDIARCKATEPVRGLGPSRRPIVADQVFLLGICENYKHCSSNVVDSLHCYQLEHHLLLLKSEALKKWRMPEAEQECKNLDLDLVKFLRSPKKTSNGGTVSWLASAVRTLRTERCNLFAHYTTKE